MSFFTQFLAIWAFCLFVSCIVHTEAADSPCGDWLQYKDEKCFKILDETTRNYDEAEKACNILANAPTLPVIHSREEQDFLVNYLYKTGKKLDNFWLGAKYTTNGYQWLDDSNLTYSNWVGKGAKNKPDYCIQMQSEENEVGRWIDEPCEKKVSVVCQKWQIWSMPQLQRAFIDARKQLTEHKHLLEEANNKLIKFEKDPIPIGFIYTQLAKEKSPSEIWPWMNWTDVSSAYAGVFFRVTGDAAGAFGSVQTENAPRLIRIERATGYARDVVESINLDSGLTSQRIFTGDYVADDSDVYNHSIDLSFVMSGGEVRPRNMAVKLWKRIA